MATIFYSRKMVSDKTRFKSVTDWRHLHSHLAGLYQNHGVPFHGKVKSVVLCSLSPRQPASAKSNSAANATALSFPSMSRDAGSAGSLAQRDLKAAGIFRIRHLCQYQMGLSSGSGLR